MNRVTSAVSGAANSIHFLVGSVHHGSHAVRTSVSFLIGVVLLVAAFLTARTARG